MVEARGLASSATKTVIALSRGSKIKTYRTWAPMWETSRSGRLARTFLPIDRGWPRLDRAKAAFLSPPKSNTPRPHTAPLDRVAHRERAHTTPRAVLASRGA